jgi:regulator of replication initiation timing
LPNKNKEQIFLRLSEGFSSKNRTTFSEKLEKYREIVSGLRQSPKQLKLRLEALRPEIVRLLKKKRTTNANKKLKTWMQGSSNMDQLQAKGHQDYSTQYYRTPEKENSCPDYL